MNNYYLKYKKYKTKYLNLQYGGRDYKTGASTLNFKEIMQQQHETKAAELDKIKNRPVINPIRVYDDIGKQLDIIKTQAEYFEYKILPNINWIRDEILKIKVKGERTADVYDDVEIQLNSLKPYGAVNQQIKDSITLIQANITTLKTLS